MKSAIWKKSPVNFRLYGITGSPAGPTEAPIGSVAAEASVAAGMGSVGTAPVDPVELASVVEVAVEVVEVSPVAVELVDVALVGLVVVAGAGAAVVAEPAASARSIDWNPTSGAVGELLQLDQEARLVAVRRHRLAEHHQLPVVDRERLLRLLAAAAACWACSSCDWSWSTSFLRLAAWSRFGARTSSQKATISPMTANESKMVCSFRLMAPSPVPGMNVSTALRPFSVFWAAESFCC